MKAFKVGDRAVHLSYGVGTIKGIEEREFIPGKVQKFYILEIQDSGAPKKCFVPFDSYIERLRPIIDKDTAKEILTYLEKGKPSIDARTWNMRYREYMGRIHTGDAKQIAEVFLSLIHLKKDKDLSFGERKLLDQAKMLLIKELSIAQDMSESEVEEELEASVCIA
jgi:CarD family transcriptional regulator